MHSDGPQAAQDRVGILAFVIDKSSEAALSVEHDLSDIYNIRRVLPAPRDFAQHLIDAAR
jgi:hypothetical protein